MKVALVILDGWGIGPADDPAHRNAITTAATPRMDDISTRGAFGTLSVSGRDVGLPVGQMGNSEVGHLNIGAGRVVYQEYTRINDAIAAADLGTVQSGDSGDIPDPPLDENPAIRATFERVTETGGFVHFVGLVSDGGVHSDYRHLFALIEIAAQQNVSAITHAFTDGRDTAPTGGTGYLGDLQAVIDEHGTGHIGSVSGRYFGMDRDENWDRTAKAYDAMVNHEAAHQAMDPVTAVERAYDRGETDEFVEPTVVGDRNSIRDGDAVLFFNFRADRARQLTRMLSGIRSDAWRSVGIDVQPPDIAVTTMTEYDRTFELPVAFEPFQPTDTLGEVLAAAGHTQLRIAESEKYAHVTYFLNGGREEVFEGEIRRIVRSPDVPTYDHQPEMNAARVTDEAIQCLESEDPDVMILNYANPDMVGHTGDFEAAVAAVEAVDTALGRLVTTLTTGDADIIVTADHGNAEDMGSEQDPHTAHTANEVPFVYLSPSGDDGGVTVRDGGILADIAPTVLSLLSIPQPPAMQGHTLLARD